MVFMSASIACIVYKDRKILIARRNMTGDMGGKWEFPGGKLDPGETCGDAVVREMREEFSVDAEPLSKICSSWFEHRGKKCSLDAFLVRLEHDGTEKPFSLTEHIEYKWVFPEEIKNLDFVDSDMKIYPDVLEYISSLDKKSEAKTETQKKES